MMHLPNFLLYMRKMFSKYIGIDAFGNQYYESRGTKGSAGRRFVIYSGIAEPSKVPPEWHLWLHYTVDSPLSGGADPAYVKVHKPNLTGTRNAYYPDGHFLGKNLRPKAAGDYKSWVPDE